MVEYSQTDIIAPSILADVSAKKSVNRIIEFFSHVLVVPLEIYRLGRITQRDVVIMFNRKLCNFSTAVLELES